MEVKPGYKQTEVGVIPEDWEVKPLRSVINKGRLGGNYANQDKEAELPLMKMGNIARGYFDMSKVEFITPGVTPERAHQLMYGDVLFNTRNTLDLVGKVAVWRDELPVAYYNSNLMRMEFDPNQVCSSEYANYALNTANAVARLRALATGTTSVAAIYTRDLMELLFIVPPLPEQRAIAEALSDVDGLLGGLDRLIAKKRDLKQAAMQQLLTGQTRLPGFHGEWVVKQLGNIAPMQRGFDLPNAELRSGPYPVVYSNGILNHHEHFQAGGPGVVTGRSGTIGKVTFVEGPYWPHNTALWVTSFKNNNPRFVFYFYTHIGFEMFATGSGVPTLNRNDVHAFEIAIPPTEGEQTAIAAVLSDMDAELVALEQRREKTRALKQAMMQELLTGKTRLVAAGGSHARTTSS
jgi:type I restriction enzyme S subunit